jgi:uncharacterized membrane protein
LRIGFDPNEAIARRRNFGVTLREVRGASGNNLLVTGSVANARIFVMRDRSADLADDEVSDTAPDSGDVEQFGAERPSVFERAIDSFEPARTVLVVCIVVWIAWFFRLPLVRHERFQTFGFDLGIYDQGVWLLSQFRDPFVTVRGLNLFGHHMNPFLLVLAPFYRAGGGVEFLLAVQVLAQASGAVAMFLLGRDLLRSRWCGVALAIALLLNPTYQWLMWEFFHPDAVAIGPLLFAYWAARERRWGWFTVSAVIALSCKEDVALAVVVLGLLVAFRLRRDQRRLAFGLGSMLVGFLVPIVIGSRDDWKFLLAGVFVLVGLYLVLDRRDGWRIGTAIALLAGAWFLLATQILIPHFNGVGRFYDSFFGPELGETPSEIARNIAQHPSLAIERITESSRQTWYWRMLAPFALLPLVYLRAFAIALPMVAVNVLTLFPYTRDYRFHYSALVVAGGAVASVEAIAWMQRVSRGNVTVRNAGVSMVVIAALCTTVAWGASPLARDYDRIWPLRADPHQPIQEYAIGLVPKDAAVSAAYDIVPHITHRARVYEFPVPWCNINWGVHGENLDDPADVQWLVLDRRLLDTKDTALAQDLLSSEFTIRFEQADIVVAQRITPAAPRAEQPAQFECQPR